MDVLGCWSWDQNQPTPITTTTATPTRRLWPLPSWPAILSGTTTSMHVCTYVQAQTYAYTPQSYARLVPAPSLLCPLELAHLPYPNKLNDDPLHLV